MPWLYVGGGRGGVSTIGGSGRYIVSCCWVFLWLRLQRRLFKPQALEKSQAGTAMTYFVLFLGLCFVLGGLAVASNPSPYYGVVGLVVASVVGCG